MTSKKEFEKSFEVTLHFLLQSRYWIWSSFKPFSLRLGVRNVLGKRGSAYPCLSGERSWEVGFSGLACIKV